MIIVDSEEKIKEIPNHIFSKHLPNPMTYEPDIYRLPVFIRKDLYTSKGDAKVLTFKKLTLWGPNGSFTKYWDLNK